MRINDYLERRIHAAALFEKAEWKFGADRKGVLVIDAAPRKYQLHFLARGAVAGDVGEVYGLRENLRRQLFRGNAFHSQRKRGPNFFFIADLDRGEHWLFGEEALRQFEAQLDSGQHCA